MLTCRYNEGPHVKLCQPLLQLRLQLWLWWGLRLARRPRACLRPRYDDEEGDSGRESSKDDRDDQFSQGDKLLHPLSLRSSSHSLRPRALCNALSRIGRPACLLACLPSDYWEAAYSAAPLPGCLALAGCLGGKA